MSFNIFKSSRDRDREGGYRRDNDTRLKTDDKFNNAFKSLNKDNNTEKKVDKEVIFDYKEELFPELGGGGERGEQKSTQIKERTLNYIEASKKEVKQTSETYLPKGWLGIYIEEHDSSNGNKNIKFDKRSIRPTMGFNNVDVTHNVMSQLVANGEKWKNDYIDLYGEDLYERIYLTQETKDLQQMDINDIMSDEEFDSSDEYNSDNDYY